MFELDFNMVLRLATFVMTFGVIPIILELRKVKTAVHDLHVLIYRDFATKLDLDKKQNKRGY